MHERVIQLQDALRHQVSQYIVSEQDIALIDKAMAFANEKHEGQMRKSGEPYVAHVIEVALILAELRVGPSTICAGLLHDTLEDCGVSKDEIKKLFSNDIATIVESVTKIGNLSFKDEKEYLAANHRKIFIAMAKDIRVILVKLVDRLHNMRTLNFQSEEKQKKIAAETLDVYAPIAHRLGISEIKNELEDLSFHYIYPDKYYDVAKLVEMRKAERDKQVNDMIHDISTLLNEHGLNHRIFGRSKHLYSIHKKMTVKNKRFDEILDLLAIRIVTDDSVNCYEVLGYIHATYRPIPGRLKDYIAMPKMNMYQSLHTTIVGDEGHIFEVQIRTESMDAIAEKGVAAHWRYKEGTTKDKNQKEIEERLSWFKDIGLLSLDIDDDDAQEYMDAVQKDIFEANVYVMTPKGRVIDLPNGSTPIDFAYRIHTDVGHTTIGAIINGVLLPLNTQLKTGDVVQIRTNKNSNGPSEDWLKFIKTSHARVKIRNFLLKKEETERKAIIIKGEQIFKEEVKKRGLENSELITRAKVESVLHQFNLKTMDECYYALAARSLTTAALFEKLVDQRKNILDLGFGRLFKTAPAKKTISKSGIKVAGVDSMMITLSQCCKPVYGDPIIGYITKGQGVKVHRIDCPNIVKEKNRLIDVLWDETFDKGKYEVELSILANDRSYLLTDLVTIISQYKASIQSVNSVVNEDKVTATTTLKVNVDDSNHLQVLMVNLRKVNSVISVERITR